MYTYTITPFKMKKMKYTMRETVIMYKPVGISTCLVYVRNPLESIVINVLKIARNYVS